MMESTVEATNEAFPRDAVERALHCELMSAAKMEVEIRGESWPEDPEVAAVLPVALDSLIVVELLCEVEPIIGFAPKDGTVRMGGYSSVQDALDHIMPRLALQWKKRKGSPR